MSGALCAMTTGEPVMLLWCVDNWGTLHKVRPVLVHIWRVFYNEYISVSDNCVCLQVQLPLVLHTLVLVLDQSIWIMLAAVVERVTSLTAPVALLCTVTVATQRMLEWDVKVDVRKHIYQGISGSPKCWKSCFRVFVMCKHLIFWTEPSCNRTLVVSNRWTGLWTGSLDWTARLDYWTDLWTKIVCITWPPLNQMCWIRSHVPYLVANRLPRF